MPHSDTQSLRLNLPLQSIISLRRIEKYLLAAEVSPVPPAEEQDSRIAFQDATLTWPRERMRPASNSSSVASTPRTKFVLLNISITFPQGELSLVCGKLGSGKTLLLLCEGFLGILPLSVA